MNNSIQSAFNQIHAEDSLKEETKQFIYQKTGGYCKRNSAKTKFFAAATACIAVILFAICGYFSYSIPVAAISIDVNPSLELEINVYNKVIGVKGYNDDGEQVAEELNVQHMDYLDAIQAVLENETIADCLKKDNLLEITIASESEQRNEKMQNCISSQTNIEAKHIYCSDNPSDVEEAHSLGLSFGKYRAFLELQAVDPDITAEEIKNLSMKEIRERIKQESATESSHSSGHSGVAGSGNGYGKGQGHR